jgi:hypothetical protein
MSHFIPLPRGGEEPLPAQEAPPYNGANLGFSATLK